MLDPDGGIPSPTNAVLGGRSGTVAGQQPLTMPRVVAAFAEDADAIDAWLVDRHDPAATPRLELIQRAS